MAEPLHCCSKIFPVLWLASVIRNLVVRFCISKFFYMFCLGIMRPFLCCLMDLPLYTHFCFLWCTLHNCLERLIPFLFLGQLSCHEVWKKSLVVVFITARFQMAKLVGVFSLLPTILSLFSHWRLICKPWMLQI